MTRVTLRNVQRTNPPTAAPVWLWKIQEQTTNHEETANHPKPWKPASLQSGGREMFWCEQNAAREMRGNIISGKKTRGNRETDRGERRWQKERERERVKGGCFSASCGVFDACAAFVLFVLTLCVYCTSRDRLITTERKKYNPNNTPGLPKQGVKHVVTRVYLLCKNWSRSHYMIASMF